MVGGDDGCRKTSLSSVSSGFLRFLRSLGFLRFIGFLRFLRSNANGRRLERDLGKVVHLRRDGEKDGDLVEREVAVTKDSE